MRKLMLLLTAVCAVAVIQTGCVVTIAPTPYGRAARLAVWQDTQANIEWTGTNQVFKMTGYSGKVDAASLNVLGQVLVNGLAEYMGKNAQVQSAQSANAVTKADVKAMFDAYLADKAKADAAAASGR